MKLWQRERDRDRAEPGETVRGAQASSERLPEPPHPVKLIMPSGERMPGRVAGREGEELLVLMLYQPERRLRPVELDSVVIEVTDDGHTTRLGGSATIVDHETLRFRDLHLVQRREYVRVKVALSVAVRIPTGANVACTSIDLSGGGMLLSGIQHVALGERIDFALAIDPSDPEIRGSATILRCDDEGHSAVCFEEISEGDRRRLIRFLFERQRDERRKGLLPEGAHGR